MAKRKQGWSLQTAESGLLSPTGPVLSPAGLAFAAQKRGEETFQWPAEPTLLVRVSEVTDEPYAIDVELVRDEEQGFVPVGVSVRRLFPRSRRRRGGDYPFAEGIRPEPVSAADMRKIPFGRIIRAAITAAASMEPFKQGDDEEPDRLLEQRHDELERILVPRGRPPRGRSVKWYCDLLEAARRFEKRGKSPAKEIARGKTGVSENLVHQWLHVARRYEREGLCGG